MNTRKEYFLCDRCKNKDFVQITNFSIHFRKVNFSDNLLHDEITEEIYQCNHCKKTFSIQQIESKLNQIILDGRKSKIPGEK